MRPANRSNSSTFGGAIVIDGEIVGGPWPGGTGGAIARCDELRRLPGRPLSPDGDTLYVDGRDSLMHIVARPTNVSLDYLSRGTVAPPDFLVPIVYQHFRSIAGAWKHAT